MFKTTVTISGMTCGMCEAHINDAVRSAFAVKKVTSSRAKGETIILSERPLDREKLRQTVYEAGYILLSVGEEEAESRPLFSRFLKRRAKGRAGRMK